MELLRPCDYPSARSLDRYIQISMDGRGRTLDILFVERLLRQ